MSEGPRLVNVGDAAVDDRLAKAAEKAVQDAAAERARHRVTAPLLANREDAAREITEEQRAKLGSRPPAGRWKDLAKFDDRLDKAQAKLTEAAAALREAERAVLDSPRLDAQTLAAWITSGEKGKRPEATLPERQRELDARRLVVAAAQIEIDKALHERRDHIERNRPSMIRDARTDVAKARSEYAANIAALAAKRDKLLETRETLAWAASYPDPVDGFGFPSALALGLRKPVHETLGTKAMVEYGRVVAALEADAEALAAAFSDATKTKLGEGPPRSPLREAMWHDEPDAKAYREEELEKARQLATEGFHDQSKLAQEVRW